MTNEEHIHIEDIHEEDTSARKSGLFVRIAVIVGMILILIFIATAIVTYVPKFISSFGQANVSLTSLFSPKEKMTVTVGESEVQSGSKFNITWKNDTIDTNGSTVWSFKCTPGITVEYSSPSGARPIVCDTLFPLPDTGSYAFTAFNSTNAPIQIPMSVSFWDKDLKTMKFSGATSITVLPKNSTGNATTTTSTYAPSVTNNTTELNTSPTNNTTNKVNNYYTAPTVYTGPADLAISLVSVGRMLSNGNFEKTSTFAPNDRVVLNFNVSNIGQGRSGAWILRGVLPTTIPNERVYASIIEPALNPGDSYQLTIAFDAFDSSQSVIQLSIDSTDTNQLNNVLIVKVSSNGSNYNNNSNCYYSNGNYYCNNNNTGGRGDLVVTITDIGIMDRSNNQFYYANSFRNSDKIAIKFTVQNIGSTDTGTWAFNASLPSNTNGTFNSGNQGSLSAGQTATFTLGFENAYVGSDTISIQADPNNNIVENNESNNYASRSVYVSN